jgi:hypothetical protein
MKNIIKIEELAKFLFSYFISLYLGHAWWIFPVWLLAPDISMLGYLINNKTGAWTYNFFHHQAMAILVGLVGMWLGSNEWQLAGLVLFGHSAMDRSLGYGLKYPDSFQHTHLGWIGKMSEISYKGTSPD